MLDVASIFLCHTHSYRFCFFTSVTDRKKIYILLIECLPQWLLSYRNKQQTQANVTIQQQFIGGNVMKKLIAFIAVVCIAELPFAARFHLHKQFLDFGKEFSIEAILEKNRLKNADTYS
jgi:hypothetical protein